MELVSSLCELSRRLLRCLAHALDLPESFFTDINRTFEDGNWSALRTLYYPPIEGPVPAGVTRCGEHSDYGTITLLFQRLHGDGDDEGDAVEVRGVDGGWISAKPVKGTVLVIRI